MMKHTTYHHHFLIPCQFHEGVWKTMASMFPYVTVEEILTSYFSNMAFMAEQGWVLGRDDGMSEAERFRQAIHMLVTLVSSDIEGMAPTPQELDLKEVEVINDFVKKLTWDLWVHLHADCWERCQLNFVRTLPDAIIVAYHGEHPFKTRKHNPFLPAQLSEM